MLPPAYEAKKYEDTIYKKWESSGVFKADPKSGKKPFSISMPPPNATGVLHLGHAVMLALQDILTRHRRMKGFEALWLPGTDHAAIATQNRVEKDLVKEGITREQLGREKFLEHVKAFVANSQDTIRNQIRKMGASCDWSRERYTLDDNLSLAVTEMFNKMHGDGLIYRGYRIVNWCPRCKSTLADDEVEHEEVRGNFYYILYPFKDEEGGLIVATTRPETMLGDTAVAVNPKDKRYKKFIGKTIVLPLLGREIPVIGDEYVDIDTGTGALKVTPAHDPNDFVIGQKHKLETIRVMDDAAFINEKGGVYKGLDRFTARKKMLEDLTELGLLQKTEALLHNVGHCYRCSTMVEPLTSDQWFIDVNKKFPVKNPKNLGWKKKEATLKELSIHAVKNGNIQIIPEQFNKTYFHWMENLRDWCVSRQIWWGHRIPVWYCKDCGEIIVAREVPAKCPKCESKNLRQDEDTLDTWFSSALWTFSTLGWPKETEDLKFFHPTSVMETGYDILFFWIARMILMTTYGLNEIPFKTVYLHGLIRTREGKKMSKSDPSTCINPLDMIEKYGADALRMSMVIGNTPGNDMRLYEEKIQGYRNFTNKLWNIFRYVLTSVKEIDFSQETKPWSLSDKWILSRFNKVKADISKDLDEFRLSQAGEKLRDFTWNELADWYLEIFKLERTKEKDAVITSILQDLLKLWHPFMPFVTEALWQEIGKHIEKKEDLLAKCAWPTIGLNWINDEVENDFEIIKNITTEIRSIRANNKIEPSKKINILISAGNQLQLIEKNAHIIKNLWTGIDKLEIQKTAKKPNNWIELSVNKISIFVDISGAIDTEKEKARLEKDINNLENYVKGLKAKLTNGQFVANAPKEIVESERKKMEEAESKVKKLKEQLKAL